MPDQSVVHILAKLKDQSCTLFFCEKCHHKVGCQTYKFYRSQLEILKASMRQLKGKVKESRKEKRERKLDNLKNKEKLWTVVIPVLLTISVIIVAYVLLSTKSK